MDVGWVAAIQPDKVSARGGDPSIIIQQEKVSGLVEIQMFRWDGNLPEDETKAHKLQEQSLYSLIDYVLYHVMKDGTLRLVPPTEDRHSIFQDARAGVFGGHLCDHTIYS